MFFTNSVKNEHITIPVYIYSTLNIYRVPYIKFFYNFSPLLYIVT